MTTKKRTPRKKKKKDNFLTRLKGKFSRKQKKEGGNPVGFAPREMGTRRPGGGGQ